jgi:hypothetical protein
MHRSKKAPLFDHLVGAQDEPGRKFKTEHLRASEVDYQLEVGRLLDRQIGRFSSAQQLDELPGVHSITSAASPERPRFR